MKKRVLLTWAAAALTAGMASQAAVLTPDEALGRARALAPSRVKGANSARYELAHVVKAADSEAACYVFSSDDNFLVLSADDAAMPVLGYADTAFDAENMAPSLQYWLDYYAREISYARSSGISYAPAAEAFETLAAVEPMLTTKWNQDAPYNDMCPEENGVRCVTGCIATAMAQVMKYHQWPEKGTGSNSYYNNGSLISLNFADITYDWANMLDTYSHGTGTDEQKQAVATLMYSCGVANNMKYSTFESGTTSANLATAFVKYFGYDQDARYMRREFYGYEDWVNIIHTQLMEYGPVLYCGDGSLGGHAFVVDGYSTDGYFHVNWGWGGLSDGYFLLTALNPDSQGIGGAATGFNSNQDIVANITKPREGSRVYEQMVYDNDFVIRTKSTQQGARVNVYGLVYNLSINALSGTVSVKFTNNATGAVTYAGGTSFSRMEPYTGFTQFAVYLPTGMLNGTYTVTPVFRNSACVWSDCLVPLSGIASATAVVNGNSITFSQESAPVLTFTEMKTDLTPYYIGCKFKITADLTNNNSTEYYGAVVAAIYDSNDNLVAYGDDFPVDVMPGETIAMEYMSSFSHGPNYTQPSIQAGEYKLVFMSSSLSTAMTEPVTITVQELLDNVPVISVKRPTLSDGTNVVVDKAHLHMVAPISCTSGYFANVLTLVIFPSSYGNVSSICQIDSQPMFLGAGESSELEFVGDFSVGEVGKRYRAAVYNGNKQLSTLSANFSISENTGIVEIGEDAPQGVDAYYSITGAPVAKGHHGFAIKVTTMPDGSTVSEKVYIGK